MRVLLIKLPTWLAVLPDTERYRERYLHLSAEYTICFLEGLANLCESYGGIFGKPLTEEVIQRIAHQCSFAEMVKNPASYQVFPGNDDIRFLRKGEIGDWKNHFTSDMNEQVETEFVAKLKEYRLEFDYCSI